MSAPTLPALGSPSPELVCSCGARFVAPVQAVQEMRDPDGHVFAVLGYASHNPAECPQAVNGTKCWTIWDEEDAA